MILLILIKFLIIQTYWGMFRVILANICKISYFKVNKIKAYNL